MGMETPDGPANERWHLIIIGVFTRISTSHPLHGGGRAAGVACNKGKSWMHSIDSTITARRLFGLVDV
jgi:hypothetical protein